MPYAAWFLGLVTGAGITAWGAWGLHRRIVVRWMTNRAEEATSDDLEKRRRASESNRSVARRANAGSPAKQSDLFPVRSKFLRKGAR